MAISNEKRCESCGRWTKRQGSMCGRCLRRSKLNREKKTNERKGAK